MDLEALEFHIAIPYGGSEAFLIETLESVLAQTYKDWKLFVIGDGINENDFKKLSLNYPDPRIEFESHPDRQGIGRMFNHCLKKLNSDWNILLGADDLLSPNFLKGIVEATKLHPEVYVIQPRTQVIDSTGKISRPLEDAVKSLIRHKFKSHVFNSKAGLNTLSIGNWLYFPSIVWSSRAIQGKSFNLDFEIALDLEFIFRILIEGGTILYWPKSLFFYRRHAASVSMHPERYILRVQEEIQVYNSLANSMFENGQLFSAFLAKIRLTSRINLLMKFLTARQNDKMQLLRLMKSL
jgi:glycosyltransferase involved in cell wall biosynthesis